MCIRDSTDHCLDAIFAEGLTDPCINASRKRRLRHCLLYTSTISVGQTDIQFFIGQERVEVVPSTKNRLGDIIGKTILTIIIVDKLLLTATGDCGRETENRGVLSLIHI